MQSKRLMLGSACRCAAELAPYFRVQELGISSAAMTIMESFIQVCFPCNLSANKSARLLLADASALRRTCSSALPARRPG